MRTPWMTLAFALLTLACGGRKSEPVPLRQLELPVVSIGLPPGDLDDTAARNANSGQLVLRNAAEKGGIVMLGWDTSEAFTEEEIAAVGRALTQELGKATVTPGPTSTVAGVEARTLLMDLGKRAPVRLTAWRCGGRNVIFAAWFRSGDLASLNDRILETVTCREAPLLAPLVPQLTLPAGWARLPDTGAVVFTNAAGNLVHIKESPSFGGNAATRATQTRASLRTFFETPGSMPTNDDIELTPLVVDGEERLLGRARTVIDGFSLTIQAVIVPCPALATYFLVAMTSLSEAPDEGAADAFFSARCPTSREAPEPAFPEALPFFEAACAGGDTASCVRVADLSEDTDYPALVDPERAERARKRACELGGPDYCPDAAPAEDP